MKFETYHISDTLKQNLKDLGFLRPTDIQYKAIPSIMKGEDVLAIAQTGTGKTAAFAIPVIDMLYRQKTGRRSRGIQCIVMVPTRELAQQIGDVFQSLARHTRVKPYVLHGGVDQDPQIRKLQEGIDILITTPGRMFDLISQGHIDLGNISILILDEADHMLDLGFIEDIRFVKKKLVKKHQTLFFSATINNDIKKLAYSQVNSSAIRIQISPEDPVSKNVSHSLIFVDMDSKRFFLRRFINEHPDNKVLVFVRTRVRAERVAKALERGGISALTIHGEKDQALRTDVMQAFRTGQSRVLIATDISARGIDIPDIDYVVNYDLPDQPENYVHRVGRTGRGVRKGLAVSFCSPEEKKQMQAIQEFINREIEVIHLDKTEIAFTLEPPIEELDLKQMIREHEQLAASERRKKPKNKRR